MAQYAKEHAITSAAVSGAAPAELFVDFVDAGIGTLRFYTFNVTYRFK